MTVDARVAVLYPKENELKIEEIAFPSPEPDQVIVKQFASGVCHSQLHQIHAPREKPVILGHESTGLVIDVGKNVSHVAPGDTVLVTWVPRDAARAERPAVAARLDIRGQVAISQNVFTWADHTIADEQYVVKVDADIPTDVTSIIGCAVMTGAGAVINTAKVGENESVAVFGVGGVGLSAIVGAKVSKAHPIIAIDLDDQKLAFAKKFGATHTINAKTEDPVAGIHKLTANESEFNFRGLPVSGADHAFDCIGLKSTMEQIVPSVRSGTFGARQGGQAVLVGVPTTPVELLAVDLLISEKQFLGSIGGSCAPDRDFPTFLDWHKKGNLDLHALVTARYHLENINEATAALENGEIDGRAILEF